MASSPPPHLLSTVTFPCPPLLPLRCITRRDVTLSSSMVESHDSSASSSLCLKRRSDSPLLRGRGHTSSSSSSSLYLKRRSDSSLLYGPESLLLLIFSKSKEEKGLCPHVRSRVKSPLQIERGGTMMTREKGEERVTYSPLFSFPSSCLQRRSDSATLQC